jgi:hypothetical protein
VASALSALQDCSKAGCGGSREFNNVVVALIVGGAYLIVAFVLGAFAVHRKRP